MARTWWSKKHHENLSALEKSGAYPMPSYLCKGTQLFQEIYSDLFQTCMIACSIIKKEANLKPICFYSHRVQMTHLDAHYIFWATLHFPGCWHNLYHKKTINR